MTSSDPHRTGRAEDIDQMSTFVAELTTTNTRLAEYVMYLTAAATGQPAPVPPPSELELAERLASAAAALCDRMWKRATQDHDPSDETPAAQLPRRTPRC
jgi:hypothetical protein